MINFYYYNNVNRRNWPERVLDIFDADPINGKSRLFAHLSDLERDKTELMTPSHDVSKRIVKFFREGFFSEIIIFTGSGKIKDDGVSLAEQLLYKLDESEKRTDHIYPMPFKIDEACEFGGFIDAVSKSDSLTARKYFDEGREETETAFCILLTIHLLRRLDKLMVDMKQPGILKELTTKCLNMDVTDTYWLPVMTGNGVLDERLRLYVVNHFPFFNCTRDWIQQLNNLNETNQAKLNKWLFERLHLDGNPMPDKQIVGSTSGICREGS